ncbi:unnamed protein product [Vitrella brassicaformis CCMP3155]|uniref:Uncharacterized protein n=1 Tax=Vitrella brassicaformis (strain CCMP3155) TaxID=1169540 RepID=A0A0G4G1H1_VITBC|nr:unnamed protein product [Vitrella brassicaformis CCMP3155]|eukprot:CEM21711.1 unnamed protein product [Vitrella brassicaformis CCMP3155]
MTVGEGMYVVYLEYTDVPPGQHPEDRPRFVAKFLKRPSFPDFAHEGFKTVRRAANKWKGERATSAKETAPIRHPPIPPASWMAPGLKEPAEEWSGWPPAVLPFHNTHINVQTDSRGVEGRTVVIMPLMEGTWDGLQLGEISVAELKGHFATALRGLHFYQERDVSIFDVKVDNMGIFKGQ